MTRPQAWWFAHWRALGLVPMPEREVRMWFWIAGAGGFGAPPAQRTG